MTRFAYREVEPEHVELSKLAQRFANLAASLLGLGPVRVRFFRGAQNDDELRDALLAELERGETGNPAVKGFMNAGEPLGVAFAIESDAIWLDADLPLADTVYTVFHEMRHRWQYVTWSGIDEAGRQRAEADAHAYGMRMARGVFQAFHEKGVL